MPGRRAGFGAEAHVEHAARAEGQLGVAPVDRALPEERCLLVADERGAGRSAGPRSGLAVKFGVTVLNSPGTIDADYRGEIRVPIINNGEAPFTVTRGMRIAQLVVAPVTRAVFVEVDILGATARGAGGFGSTVISE